MLKACYSTGLLAKFERPEIGPEHIADFYGLN